MLTSSMWSLCTATFVLFSARAVVKLARGTRASASAHKEAKAEFESVLMNVLDLEAPLDAGAYQFELLTQVRDEPRIQYGTKTASGGGRYNSR